MQNISHSSSIFDSDKALNQFVHQGRRSDFSLILAMMSNDVRDYSQFAVKKAQSENVTTGTETNLYQDLDVREPAPLIADVEELRKKRAVDFDSNTANIRLNLLLQPKPLAAKDDFLTIEDDVRDNLSPHALRKLHASNIQYMEPFEDVDENSETMLYEWLEQFDKTKPIRLIQHQSV